MITPLSDEQLEQIRVREAVTKAAALKESEPIAEGEEL